MELLTQDELARLISSVIFTRAASAELIDAQAWYENEAPGWAAASGKPWTP